MYTWSLDDGSLPVGLTLDESGLLSGTPTSAGSFAFRVLLQAPNCGSSSFNRIPVEVTIDP